MSFRCRPRSERSSSRRFGLWGSSLGQCAMLCRRVSMVSHFDFRGAMSSGCRREVTQRSILVLANFHPDRRLDHGRNEGDESMTYAAPYPVSVSPPVLLGNLIKFPLAPIILSKPHGGIVSVAPPSGIKIWSNPPFLATSIAGVGSQTPEVGDGTMHEHAELIRDGEFAHCEVKGGGEAVGIG